MNFLFYLGSFALALGLLIVVHELGHFVVARMCGVKVLRFCVGFGKPLISRKFSADGTEWALAAFPLGGYVKMLDEREGEVATADLPKAFNRQVVWKRMLIVVAGPLANLLLAVCLYWGIFVHGVEELRPVLGVPAVSSPAAAAGFVDGELVLGLDGNPVLTWSDFRWQLLQKALKGDVVQLEVINERREISHRRLDLTSLDIRDMEGDPLQKIGLRLYKPSLPPVIGKLAEGGVAILGGVMVGDRVVNIDGRPVSSWGDLVSVVRGASGKRLVFDLERNGKMLSVPLVPAEFQERGETVGRIGVAAMDPGPELRARLVTFVSYGVLNALHKASVQTWETSSFSLKIMGRMVLGEVSWRNLSGPVSIADYAGQSAKQGILPYIRFLALISISLGILNLLPVPILDGGHLMYYIAEVIKGGPVSEKALEIGQRFGLALLGMLMAFAFFNDFSRLFSS